MYAATSMSSRLSALTESEGISSDEARASYLERKLRHGRGRKRD